MVTEHLKEANYTLSVPRHRMEGTKLIIDYELRRDFNVTHEYVYDNAKFYIGSFKGEGTSMIESETFAKAVFAEELSKPTPENILSKFKEKLQKTGLTIHGVIHRFKRNNKLINETNFGIDLWAINLLIT